MGHDGNITMGYPDTVRLRNVLPESNMDTTAGEFTGEGGGGGFF